MGCVPFKETIYNPSNCYIITLFKTKGANIEMEMWWDVVGMVAAACTTSGFLPQLIRGVRTRRLDDVSPGLLVLLIVGCTLWSIYGMHQWDKIIIGANAIAVTLVSTTLFLRSYYIRKRDKVYDGRDKERYR